MASKISKNIMTGIFFLPIIFAWFTLRKGIDKKVRIIAFGWMIIFIGAAAGQMHSDFNNQYEASHKPVHKPVASAPPAATYEMTAYKLYGDYKSNKVRAENRYKGKYVKITGRIGKISKDISQTAYITLETSRDSIGPRYKIQAMFKDPARVMTVSSGQTVTIVCKVSGKVGNLICREAYLIN